MKTKQKRRGYPYNWATSFGVTGLNATDIIASSFMSSYFLLYLTDYAGLGKLGATIAPIILVIGRIVDAINDPLQGFIMDSSKPRKFGKFRFFCLLSLILSTIGVGFLYSIPESIKTNVVMLFIWVLLFYLVYDMGSSFFAIGPLIQSFSSDDVHRAKLMLYQRLISIFLGAVFSAFMMIVNVINKNLNNLGKAFSIATMAVVVISFVISLVCLFLVKEGGSTEEDIKAHEEADKTTVKDFIDVFRHNNAFTVHFAAQIFRGLVYALMVATSSYYMKWMYSADLKTGEFDADKLALITILSAMITLVPMLLSVSISPLLEKKLKSNVRLMNLGCMITFVVGLLMFIMHVIGLMELSLWIFLAMFFILVFGNGLCFIPTQTIGLECMDYNYYKTGKTMAGVIQSFGRFLGKAHAALSTLMIGFILSWIGYSVDSVTGNYAGDLDRMPELLTWFMVVSALLPSIFSVISILIYRKYPIDEAVKEEMRAAMGK